MTLHIHRSERADGLVDALADVLAVPLEDPFTAEIVSVPTRGVERWLTQQLSATLGAAAGRHDGVCANVAFPFPARLVDAALRAGPDGTPGGPAGPGTTPDTTPDTAPGAVWRPERLVWPLLEVVGDCIDEPWLAGVAAHLRGPVREGTGPLATGRPGDGPGGKETGQVMTGAGSRRFATARRIADLYDRYSVHRPDMVRAWARGDEVDDLGRQLGADRLWQARLWAHLRRAVAVASPAESVGEACDRLRADPTLSDLPRRLSVFGLTRLPASHAEVLRALGAGRAVHLFMLHPSAALWDEVAAVVVPPGPLPRRLDPSAASARHPLLVSWGRDAREMQLVTARWDPDTPAGTSAGTDRHHPVAGGPTTLLGRLQDDVRANREPPGLPFATLGGAVPDRRMLLGADDRSISVHSCHGRSRQVEVLRDAILHLLADDHTLEPRDVIVMCPDIEVFAPLIHATFGAGTDPADDPGPPLGRPTDAGATGPDATDRRRTDAGATDPGPTDPSTTDQRPTDQRPTDEKPTDLRVRLADRSLRQTNAVLAVVSEVLDLVEGRLTASQVLDLASRAPVRARFGFDDDDLGRLEQWVDTTGIRWGLDAAHRQPYGLGNLDANTWRSGLDRLLLGAAMSEDDLPLVGGVLPLDDVDSGDLDLAGRLAELVDRLATVVDLLRVPQPVSAWSEAIAAAATALTATSGDDDWQTAQVHSLLDEVVAEATLGGQVSPAELTLSEVQALLADRLRGRPTRTSFRTGHLTVCTLVPMRSVPHRVVCLLGLDDGLFPRQASPDGDDLMQRDPCVGDRDSRSEDRQLLLDALLAATEALVITYSGRDPRTNAPLPPAVPLGELLDVVDATARTDDGRASRRITVGHALQPFDTRNYAADPGGQRGPWSFDPVNLRGARASVAPRRPAGSALTGPLPDRPTGIVELDDLVRFVHHPVRAFFRQRLGVSLAERTDDVDDGLPIDLDGLGRWGVGDRMLGARLAGASATDCRAAEVARGLLPPGALGQVVVDAVGPVVEQLVEVADRYGRAPASSSDAPSGAAGSVDISVDLGDGATLVGTVTGLSDGVALAVTYSTIRARQRLSAWLRLLALTAADPARRWTAVTVGQHRRAVGVSSIGPLPGDPETRALTARHHLRTLLDLYRRGMTEPLPLYCGTSAAWAAARRAGRDPVVAARREWWTDPAHPTWEREDRDSHHRWALDGIVDLDDLVGAAPRPDEAGPDWAADETSRLGRYALRLWTGPLDHERTDPA